ncbi:hypothetical protein BKA67DRAFT_149620 [Truncatella angustata]|uniref:Uncharacterized protein n=1 Tax=Truncatella angustata TaxID=152316 RepID=A0A9P8UQC6_9PEZI|nr:uncharacterized protein BKA67DRAFT_149620 [Truncatella angustata]KAH6656251.1 hypothetical protein BKA67DRAFT_149620 [Truncatella angustata]
MLLWPIVACRCWCRFVLPARSKPTLQEQPFLFSSKSSSVRTWDIKPQDFHYSGTIQALAALAVQYLDCIAVPVDILEQRDDQGAVPHRAQSQPTRLLLLAAFIAKEDAWLGLWVGRRSTPLHSLPPFPFLSHSLPQIDSGPGGTTHQPPRPGQFQSPIQRRQGAMGRCIRHLATVPVDLASVPLRT